MRNIIVTLIWALLIVLTSCNCNTETGFDWDEHDKIEYTIDYTVSFGADHDSTMQVTASSNYGTARVIRAEAENLVDADGRAAKNTFIVLEDSVPAGKNITMSCGNLTYGGGKPEFIHVQTVGSDDLVEFYVLGTNAYTLYSIRDNRFYGPNELQAFTIPGGHRFSVVLPVMTDERYPKNAESRCIRLGFEIAADNDV